MPFVTYTALRELDTTVSPIHVANTSYSIEFNAVVSHPQNNTTRIVHRSIGGARETIRHRHERVWVLDVAPMTDLDPWHEFLNSVDGGESFTFDPDGTVSVPVNPVTAYLNTESWTFERLEFTSTYKLSTLLIAEA